MECAKGELFAGYSVYLRQCWDSWRERVIFVVAFLEFTLNRIVASCIPPKHTNCALCTKIILDKIKHSSQTTTAGLAVWAALDQIFESPTSFELRKLNRGRRFIGDYTPT
ncbi:hypothetical protein quinque_009962 [Culex quinquefasciatus]